MINSRSILFFSWFPSSHFSYMDFIISPLDINRNCMLLAYSFAVVCYLLSYMSQQLHSTVRNTEKKHTWVFLYPCVTFCFFDEEILFKVDLWQREQSWTREFDLLNFSVKCSSQPSNIFNVCMCWRTLRSLTSIATTWSAILLSVFLYWSCCKDYIWGETSCKVPFRMKWGRWKTLAYLILPIIP